MRILHVLGKLDRGGAETWLMQVLRHIDRRRWQMDFLVHTAEPGAYDAEARALGARVIPCLEPRAPLRYGRNFCRVLRQFGPYDVVHSHVHYHSGVVLALSSAVGVPIRVACAHTASRFRSERPSLGRKAYARAMRRAIANHATAGLAVSESAAECLYGREWQKTGRWSVSHLGTDLARFECPTVSAVLRRHLGIPDESLIVGHVGRFEAPKNHEFLLKIAGHFVRLEQRAHFLLVGDGSLRTAIERKIREAGLEDRFHLLGSRGDVPQLMCGAMDLFVFPSRYEGLPITLLEAQAAGLPCLVSDRVTRECDTITELIAHASLEAGAELWAHRLYAMAGQRRLAPADARARLSYWSIEASTERLLSFYEGLASHREQQCEVAGVPTGPFRWLRSR